jgi:hypothetical protein
MVHLARASPSRRALVKGEASGRGPVQGGMAGASVLELVGGGEAQAVARGAGSGGSSALTALSQMVGPTGSSCVAMAGCGAVVLWSWWVRARCWLGAGGWELGALLSPAGLSLECNRLRRSHSKRFFGNQGTGAVWTQLRYAVGASCSYFFWPMASCAAVPPVLLSSRNLLQRVQASTIALHNTQHPAIPQQPKATAARREASSQRGRWTARRSRRCRAWRSR